MKLNTVFLPIEDESSDQTIPSNDNLVETLQKMSCNVPAGGGSQCREASL